MPAWQDNGAGTVRLMSLTRIVIGATLGCLAAEGLLYGLRHLASRLVSEEVLRRIGRLRRLGPGRGSTFMAGFVRYAGIIGVTVALITLGVWALGDYWADKSAPTIANVFGPAPAPADTSAPAENAAEPAPAASTSPPVAAVSVEGTDPYIDPDFRVRRPAHRPGTRLSLKATLLQRSEAKARADLLREIQQHVQRSQYDCEAADRATRYLKAGLDVWGFSVWQLKHFPVGKYKGATLAQCRPIKNVVDPAWLDLGSTLAQRNHP
jgi:hypothetical protein